jgi:hypothetical protein
LEKTFVIKPIYFGNGDGPSEIRMYLVFNTHNPMVNEFNSLVPNFIIRGKHSIMDDLTKYFHDHGIPASDWRISTPTFAKMNQYDEFIPSEIDIIDAGDVA